MIGREPRAGQAATHMIFRGREAVSNGTIHFNWFVELPNGTGRAIRNNVLFSFYIYLQTFNYFKQRTAASRRLWI